MYTLQSIGYSHQRPMDCFGMKARQISDDRFLLIGDFSACILDTVRGEFVDVRLPRRRDDDCYPIWCGNEILVKDAVMIYDSHGRIHLVDSRKGETIFDLKVASALRRGCCIVPEGQTALFAASRIDMLSYWAPELMTEIMDWDSGLHDRSGANWFCEVTQCGSSAVVDAEQGVVVCDLRNNGKPMLSIQEYNSSVLGWCLTDDLYFISMHSNGRLLKHNIQTGDLLAQALTHPAGGDSSRKPYAAIIPLSDGRMYSFRAFEDARVLILDRDTLLTQHILRNGASPVIDAAEMPNNTLVISHMDGTLCHWSLANGELLNQFQAFPVYSDDFIGVLPASETGCVLAWSNEEDSLGIWRLSDGCCLRRVSKKFAAAEAPDLYLQRMRQLGGIDSIPLLCESVSGNFLAWQNAEGHVGVSSVNNGEHRILASLELPDAKVLGLSASGCLIVRRNHEQTDFERRSLEKRTGRQFFGNEGGIIECYQLMSESGPKYLI